MERRETVGRRVSRYDQVIFMPIYIFLSLCAFSFNLFTHLFFDAGRGGDDGAARAPGWPRAEGTTAIDQI